MMKLHELKNTTRPFKKRKRVGRGVGSKTGKTCGRGEKGAGARAGSKMRYGKEGGNMPIFMKMPIRGFSNFNFRTEYDVVNLDQIDAMYEDGEVVNALTLREHGFLSGPSKRLKILANGTLSKKVTIQAHAFSKTARAQLADSKIEFEVLECFKK